MICTNQLQDYFTLLADAFLICCDRIKDAQIYFAGHQVTADILLGSACVLCIVHVLTGEDLTEDDLKNFNFYGDDDY